MKITHEHIESAIGAIESAVEHKLASQWALPELAQSIAALETIMNHLDKVNEVVEKAQI